MTPAQTIDASGMLLLLVNAALRTLVVAAVAGLGLASFRVKATSARLLTWTAVLFAALSLPFLLWLLPSIPVPLPVLTQTTGLHASSGVATSSVAHPASIKNRRSNHSQAAEDSRLNSLQGSPLSPARSQPRNRSSYGLGHSRGHPSARQCILRSR